MAIASSVGILEQVVEVGREARLRVLRRIALAVLRGEVAAPGELGDAGQVAHDVRSPVAQADDADAYASQLDDLAVPAAVRAGGVAEVDHELCALARASA